MKCLECKELTRSLDSASTAYDQALSSAFYLVSTEIAARKQVDMERAKSAWDEHAASCAWVRVLGV
jgi:hypothetical protein